MWRKLLLPVVKGLNVVLYYTNKFLDMLVS